MITLAAILWESIRAIPRIVPFNPAFIAAPVMLQVVAMGQPFTPPAQFHSVTSEPVQWNPPIYTQEETAHHLPDPQAARLAAIELPPMPPDVVVVGATNPATYSLKYLKFDPVPGASGYQIFVTPIAQGRAVDVSTNFFTPTNFNAIPHLLYGSKYWIQAETLAPGTNSDLSMPFQWPQPIITYDPVTVEITHDTTNWAKLPAASVVVTNAPGSQGYYRVGFVRTNNVDPYQIRE